MCELAKSRMYQFDCISRWIFGKSVNQNLISPRRASPLHPPMQVDRIPIAVGRRNRGQLAMYSNTIGASNRSRNAVAMFRRLERGQ